MKIWPAVGVMALLLFTPLHFVSAMDAPSVSEVKNMARESTPAENQSDRIANVQRMLNELGYDAGTIDGVLGPQTKSAICAFHRDNNREGDCKRHFTDGAMDGVIRLRLAAAIGKQKREKIRNEASEWWACPPQTNVGTNNDYLAADKRWRYAEFLLTAARNTLDAVPRLSPAENKWLDDELSADDTNRRLAAKDSEEYKKRLARNVLEANVAHLTPLAKDGNSLSLQKQVHRWASIAFNYTDTEFPETIFWLHSNNVIHIKSLTLSGMSNITPRDRLEWTVLGCDMHGRFIRNNIVIPYLDGLLSE